MFGLAEPWWLLALLTIPLIRWLHRWRAPLTSVSVSARFLWGGTQSIDAGGNMQQPPDAAWWRRALVGALLVLALAQPWQQREDTHLTVWIDDSLSMASIEFGRTRLAEGLDRLARDIDVEEFSVVTLRSLTNQAQIVSMSNPGAFSDKRWLGGRPAATTVPPPALLSTNTAHWLVTDGAMDGLQDWVARSPLNRVIHVGESTDNVAITRLAARRRPAGETGSDVLVDIVNRGREIVQRDLQLRTGVTQQAVASLTLAPGETKQIAVHMESVARSIVAVLRPTDGLPIDDELTLDTTALAEVPIMIDTACAAPLLAVLDAHPGLQIASVTNAAELEIRCSAGAKQAPALLRFHAGPSAQLSASPTWLPAAGRLQDIHLRSGWVAASAWPQPGLAANDQVLMVADSEALIIRNDSAGSVESIVDVGLADLYVQPEFAALIAGLVDIALGRSVLDPVAAVATNPVDSNIVPIDLVKTAANVSRPNAMPRDLNDVFLALALIILGTDIVLLFRSRRELHVA